MNEELLKRLDVLAEKLGTTAEKMWTVLVKQSRVHANGHLVRAIGFLVLALSLGGVSGGLYHEYQKTTQPKIIKGEKYQYGIFSTSVCPKGASCVVSGTPAEYTEPDRTVVNPEYGWLVGAGLTILAAVVFLFTAGDEFLWRYKYRANPEYYALQEILEVFE